jgi:hypothetical protein
MSRGLWIGVALVAFVLGVLSSNHVIGAYRLVSGGGEQQCLTRQVCVGDEVRQIFTNDVTDKVGGLTLRICGEGSSARYDFVLDLVEGTPCASGVYYLEFRDQTTRTLVRVAQGRIETIRRGPLHVIDF